MQIRQDQKSLYSRFLWLIDILAYSIMISLVIFGIGGYVCSLLLDNMKIEYWAIILATAFITVFVLLIYIRKDEYAQYKFSLKSFILGLLPYLLLIPSIMAVVLSTRLQISNHAPIHMGYITQILNGISPPENPLLPGYPANNYWLYHAFLSLIVYVFHIAQPAAATVVNIGAIFGTLYFIRKSLSVLGLSNNNPCLRSFYSLFILFGANLFASFHILGAYLLQEDIPLIKMIKRENFVLLGDLRLQNLLMKYLNFAGVGMGVLYFSFALYIGILIVKGKLSSGKIFVLSIAVLGALIFHTTIGIFTLLVIPASVLISILFIKKEIIRAYIQNTKSLEIMALIIAVVLLFIPILDYIHKASVALPAEVYFGESVSYIFLSIVSIAYPLIPLAAIAIIFFIKKDSAVILFFAAISTLGYALSLIVDLPDYNQYKFVYLATLALCFLGAYGLEYLYFDLRGKFSSVGKFTVYIILIILSLNLLLVGTKFIKSELFRDRTYHYEKGSIALKESYQFSDSYEWIRENTPSDTIVILPLASKNTGKERQLNGNIYIIGERLSYVAFGDFFVEAIDEYYTRAENVNLFYSERTPVEKKSLIIEEFIKFSRERHALLLVPKEFIYPASEYLENLQLIYNGKDANIYSFPNE